MSVWSIQGEGDFNDLGIVDAQVTFQSASVSRAQLRVPVNSTRTADPLFAYKQAVAITRDGQPFFSGVCITPPLDSAPNSQAVTYDIVDAWWWLERIAYRQRWKTWDADAEAVAWSYKSRCILGQDEDGNRLTSGEQIRDLVDYAIAKGAPLQREDLSAAWPAIPLIYQEEKGKSCAQHIASLLQLAPDAIAWIDHSTAPPTFRCSLADNLAAVTVAYLPSDVAARIVARNDLQIPGLTVDFESTYVEHIDAAGETPAYDIVHERTVTQEAGTVDAPDAVFETIQLSGGSSHMLAQAIVVEAFPDDGGDPAAEDLDNEAFWTERLPWLADAGITGLSIHDGARDHTDLPSILIEGTIQPWMDVDAEPCIVTAKVDYYQSDADAETVVKKEDVLITFRCVVTDATSKTYRRQDSQTAPESIPAGFADALYASWSRLQYDGRISRVAAAGFTDAVVGNALNLSGGRSAWASMAALVQRVSHNLATGSTTIDFGPPRQLTADTLMQMLRALRDRPPSIRAELRLSGSASDSPEGVALGGKTPRSDATRGEGAYTQLVLKSTQTATSQRINLDPAAITDDQTLEIKPRKFTVCNGDTPEEVWLLVSNAVT